VEEGIIIIDKNYQILRVNKDTLRQSGLEYRDLIGKKCFEALERSDRPCERCPFSETLMTKKPVFLEKANRSTGRSVQMRVFPILDEAGEVVGAVEMARDVTEEKRSGIRKEVVNKVNKILASSLDVKKMIHATRIQLNRVLDFEKISIALFDEESGGYRFFAVEKDYEAEAFAGNIFFPLRGTGFFRRVIDTGEPIIISDFSECDSLVLQKLLKDEGIRLLAPSTLGAERQTTFQKTSSICSGKLSLDWPSPFKMPCFLRRQKEGWMN
jgi:PAS domain S-box-containing protein